MKSTINCMVPTIWHCGKGKGKTVELVKRSVVSGVIGGGKMARGKMARQSTEDFRAMPLFCMILWWW
jgi:hypothetical protein